MRPAAHLHCQRQQLEQQQAQPLLEAREALPRRRLAADGAAQGAGRPPARRPVLRLCSLWVQLVQHLAVHLPLIVTKGVTNGERATPTVQHLAVQGPQERWAASQMGSWSLALPHCRTRGWAAPSSAAEQA